MKELDCVFTIFNFVNMAVFVSGLVMFFAGALLLEAGAQNTSEFYTISFLMIYPETSISSLDFFACVLCLMYIVNVCTCICT